MPQPVVAVADVRLGHPVMMATEFARKDYAHSEGRDAFLRMAVGSIAVSATMQMIGNKQVSVFVGQWPPTFLILGL